MLKFLSFYVKVFYVMGKALSGELSCPCDRSCYQKAITSVTFSVLLWVTNFSEKVVEEILLDYKGSKKENSYLL